MRSHGASHLPRLRVSAAAANGLLDERDGREDEPAEVPEVPRRRGEEVGARMDRQGQPGQCSRVL